MSRSIHVTDGKELLTKCVQNTFMDHWKK